MNLILCNDDGALAVGYDVLLAAAMAADGSNGEGYRFWAPHRNRSGCGSSITIKGRLGPDSSPLDYLRCGLAGLDDPRRRPSWALSGINDGANIGRMMMCSGTVCLAAYAAEEGIPAIAISQHRPLDPDRPDFTRAVERLTPVLKRLFKLPPPTGHFYNVNLPFGARPCLGAIFTSERGTGGYVPKFVRDGETRAWEIKTEFVAESQPEQLLERGHIVIQLMSTMRAVPLANQPWGDGKEWGGDKATE